MRTVSGVSDDEQWKFGPFLSQAITMSGLSKREVARRAEISEGRLRQLETGYQRSGDHRIPIRTTAGTVLSLSSVLGFDYVAGLRLAGLDDDVARYEEVMAVPDYTAAELEESSARWEADHGPTVGNASTDQLLDELRKRYVFLRKTVDDLRMEAVHADDDANHEAVEWADRLARRRAAEVTEPLAAREVHEDDVEPRDPGWAE